ncbi:MAG: DoxX family protein [Myxococcota bacterium]
MISTIRILQDRIGNASQPYILLILRILFGYAMFRAGYGKFTNGIEGVAGFFADLGIPAPLLNAYVVSAVELVGGLLIMVGLATRFTSAVLVVVMLVALFTAHMGQVTEIFSAPGAIFIAKGLPVPYIAVLLVTGAFGAGRFSVDHVLAGRS